MAELDIAINPSGAVRGGNVVKQIMRDIKDAASGAQGSMVNLGATFGRVLGTGPALFATGLGAMAAASIAAAKSTATHIQEIQKFALQTNLSTREAQLFASMAKQTGTDLSALSGGMGKLNQNLQDAAKGSGDSQRLFQALGVSVKDSNGKVRETGKVFEDVIGKLGDFQNDSAKTTVISKLLGDEMQQMARIGREGFKNLSSEAKLMNAILGEDSVQAAERFNQHIARTGTILEAWKLAVGEKVLPVLNSLLEGMNKLFTGRDLPAMGTPGKGAEGNKSLVLPPDPAVLRRMLEEQTKQQIEASNRSSDFFVAGQDKQIAAMRKQMAAREDMSTTTMELIRDEHRAKMSALISEERKIRDEIKFREAQFAKDQQIGGLSDADRDLRALQHRGELAALQGKLGLAKQKTGTQALLFDADEFETEARLQEELGQRIQDSLTSTFQIGEDIRHREQDQTIKHFESLARFQEAYGTSRENELQTQYDLVRATLAKELDVNYDTAAKVLDAWRNSDHERAEMLLEGTQKSAEDITAAWQNAMAAQREISLKFSDDFFEGFARSMKKYVDDKSMLGLGVDQARRVAQGMEQAFGQFFFDAMEGRIQSFKDIVQGLTDFAKQIISQLAGQMITMTILRGVMGGFGGGAGGASPVPWLPSHRHGGIAAFASGGIAHRPMLRWAGGGLNLIGEGANSEAYVPLPDGNRIPVALNMKGPVGMPAMMPEPKVSVPISIQVINQHDSAQVQTQQRTGANGMQEIEIFVTQKMNEAITKGRVDTALRQRFDQRPSLVRR